MSLPVPLEVLAARIDARSARVAVVGLGHVGLPTAVAFARAGFAVSGLDVDPQRVADISAGSSPSPDVPDGDLARLVLGGSLVATTDRATLRDADAVIVAVPTGLNPAGDPDPGALVAAAGAIADHLRPGQLVIVASTTWPGATRQLVLPILERAGLEPGGQWALAYAPERIDPGNATFHLSNTPRIVAGLDRAATDLVTRLYRGIAAEVHVLSSLEAAEMAKLHENAYRAVNIALANEVAIMCDHLGLDPWEVIGAAATKPFGFMPFWPGPGVGGHCIPVDPRLLAWRMGELGYRPPLVEAALRVNAGMPARVVDRVAAVLASDGIELDGAEVLLLGVAYKAGVADSRETPAREIARLLAGLGARVRWHDPLVTTFAVPGVALEQVDELDPALAPADVAVLLTAHPGYDREAIRRLARRFVDTRGPASVRT